MREEQEFFEQVGAGLKESIIQGVQKVIENHAKTVRIEQLLQPDTKEYYKKQLEVYMNLYSEAHTKIKRLEEEVDYWKFKYED